MYKIGLVITAKAAGRDLIRQLAFRKICLIESDDAQGSLRVIYNNIGSLPEQLLPHFHVVHLRFSKLNRRELHSQLRFLSTHPLLFTRMALVICEVNAAMKIGYSDIAQVLEQQGVHRINMDYFLVLCTKTVDEVYKVYSEGAFLCNCAIDYFNHLGEAGQYSIATTTSLQKTIDHE